MPIFLRHDGSADTLLMGLDYDELLLSFAGWSFHAGAASTGVSDSQNDSAEGIVTAAIEFDPTLGAGEVSLLVWAQFRFRILAFADGEYEASERTGLDLMEDTIRLVPTGSTPAPGEGVVPEVSDGNLLVYLRNMVEFGSARLTPHFQSFRIPVYVTHPEASHDVMSMGLDYDELFLTLVDVTPAEGEGPQEDLSRRNITWAGKSGVLPGSLELHFGGRGFPRLLRYHLLDLHFEFVPGDGLPGELRITPIPESEDTDVMEARGGGQGADLRSGTLEVVPSPFLRGDVSLSGRIDVADVVIILDSAYLGALSLPCREAADANDNGVIDVSDSIYLLNFIFRAGPRPAAPYPEIGLDPDYNLPGALGCESYGPPYFELLPLR